MDNTILMNILNPRNNLLHKLNGLLLVQSLPFDDIIKKLSAFSILHDEMNIGFCLYYLSQE